MAARKPYKYQGRNPVAPRADRVFLCCNLNENSNTPGWLVNGAPQRLYGATFMEVSSNGGFGTDSDGDYYQNDSSNTISWHAPSGSGPVHFPEGTLVIRWKNAGDNSVSRPIFCSNNLTTSGHGRILINYVSGTTATVRVAVIDAATTRSYDFTDVTRSGVLHTLVLRWGGPAGVRATIDGAAPSSSSNSPTTYQGPMITQGSNHWAFGFTSTPQYGNIRFHGIYAWDCALSDDEVNQVLYDPHIAGRPPVGYVAELAAASTRADSTAYSLGALRVFSTASRYIYEVTTAGTSDAAPPADAEIEIAAVTDNDIEWTARVPSFLLDWAGAWQCKPQTTSVTFHLCTSPWMVASGTNYKVRVKVSATQAGLDAAGAAATSSALTTAGQGFELTATGLSAGTQYFYRLEWTDDNGTTWYGFPIGDSTCKTRATSGDVNWVAFSDCHCTVGAGGQLPSDLGWNADIVYEKDTNPLAVNQTTGYRNRFAAGWTAQTIKDSTPPDFIVWMGDNCHPDNDPGASTSDTTSYKWQQYRSMLVFYAQIICRQANFYVLGNHEGECGFHQSADSGTHAMQKQAWNVRVNAIANPTSSTYSQGGEAGNSSADWVGTADTALLHSTTTPLQNYYGFTWGDVLFVVLDTWRYSDVGGDDSAYRDEPGQYAIGATQSSWLQGVLKASGESKKVILAHSLVGGVSVGQVQTTGFYSRGSGSDINHTEPYNSLGVDESPAEISLHALARAYGVTLYCKGHDHKYCRSVRNGVHYVTCPTAGAASHTQLNYPGWNQNNGDGTEWTQMQATYGSSQSLGQTDAAGDPITDGPSLMMNVIGYLTFLYDESEDELSHTVIQTCLQTSGASEADANKYVTPFNAATGRGYGERWLANVAHTPSTNAVNLATGDTLNPSPAPRAVGTAVLDSAVTGSWWTGLVTERYAPRAAIAYSNRTWTAGEYFYPNNPNGYLYRVTTGGASTTEATQDGTAATDYPTTIGNSVTTGGITFMCVQRYSANYPFDERIQSNTIYVTTASDVQVEYVPRVVHGQVLTNKPPEAVPASAGGKRARYFQIMPP